MPHLGPNETPETVELTQRSLLLKTYFATVENTGHLTRINGTIADLQRSLYGCPERGEEGIQTKVLRNEKWIEARNVRWKTIAAFIAVLGSVTVIDIIKWFTG